MLWFYIKAQRAKREHLKRAMTEKTDAVQEYFRRVNKEKKLPAIATTSILLKEKEEVYLEDSVSLFETRKVTKSDRGGGAVRVMRGVYIGGSRGTSRSYDEMREVDSGQLILTNKRFIFNGNHSSKDVALNKILSINEYSDGIEVAFEGRTKSQTFVGIQNPYLWKALIQYVRAIPPSGELPTATVEIR